MNYVGIIILLFVLTHFAVLLAANILNQREQRLPEEFGSLYASAEYQRFQAYLRERGRLTLGAHLFGTLVFLGVWAAGGFGALDNFLRAQPLPELMRGVAYVMTALLVIDLLGIPAAYLSTFVVEEKYGFNRTRMATFVADNVRRIAIKILVLPPFVYGLLWIFQFAQRSAFIWLWLFVSAIAVLQKYVLIPWVQSSFHKFTPLAAGELRDAILAYAAKINFPLKDVLTADSSRRSTKGGAHLIGFGKSRKAVISDTLIGKMSEQQIVALVAQEIGLERTRKPVLDAIVGALVHGVIFLCLALFVFNDDVFAAFGIQPSVYAGIVFFSILFPALELAIFAPVFMLMRRHIFEADAYAVATLGGDEALIDALKQLSVRSFQNLTPHPLSVTLHDQTPPVLLRIQRLRGRQQTTT
jgi:STE24 endopeptidase